ncbi:MAG: XTP/dITP diphosphatase [Candidatus Micrarchaeota archaeon]
MIHEVFFATSNSNKVAEATEVLGREGIAVRHFPFEYRELRSDDLEEVARDAAAEAFRRCRMPVFVEDTGLFINALNGFPGTFSGWVQKKLGNAGILKIMAGVEDRSARFATCIAYHDGFRVSCFAGACRGSIALGERGSSGFGYDSIFVPEGHSQTFAESIQLKNKLSHRYKSLLEFSKSLHTLR